MKQHSEHYDLDGRQSSAQSWNYEVNDDSSVQTDTKSWQRFWVVVYSFSRHQIQLLLTPILLGYGSRSDRGEEEELGRSKTLRNIKLAKATI